MHMNPLQSVLNFKGVSTLRSQSKSRRWWCKPLWTVLASVFVLPCLVDSTTSAEEPQNVDVLVFGATPAGIAASIGAAQDGCSVLLVEPTHRIGGLVTSGLSHTDFHSRESLSGAFLHFAQQVEAYYSQKYGPDSPQVKDSFGGTFAEPKVNLLVMEKMLEKHVGITIRRNHQLTSVDMGSPESGKSAKIDPSTTVADAMRTIRSVSFTDASGNRRKVACKIAIDGSYEGDLMAMAGTAWRAGREGREEYHESLAPEKVDDQLQAYNFRFVMTKVPKNRVTPQAPPGYRREDFVGVLDPIQSGKIRKIFDYPSNCIFKAQTPPLPNGKYDINDVSRNIVRLSLPGQNRGWPNGSQEERRRIFDEHVRDQVGLLYFLQNDEAVPEAFRKEAQEWGMCRDEFEETNHLPPQLYVREARRMIGKHVYTQSDSEHAPNDARATLHVDSIAMADYGNNCHGTDHEGPRFGGKHTGEFYNPVPPYQIPYGVLVPRDIDNLLVPTAASSTHVGFCALRLEPVWMSLGQAAGHAAAQSIQRHVSVQDVAIRRLQHRLHAVGSATIYVSDVLPSHPDFRAVQWWGTLGGLHGLAPMPAKPGQRGRNLHGQYYEASPGQAAELDKLLDAETLQRWKALAKQAGFQEDQIPQSAELKTRGDFIRKIFQAANISSGTAQAVR
jgi:FAD dependent oxidoreductase